MRKFISILFVYLTATAVTGCANSGNPPDEQRARAEKAQGELSSEVRK
ncbi:MAG: hypothetical protein WC825_07410 [Gallionellaceae bacterium]|jgi:hypothetical protein